MKFLLILFLIIIAFMYLPRMFFLWLSRQMGKRVGNYTQNDGQAANNNNIKKPPHQDKKVDKQVGEYVEYEEIKE